MEQRTKILWLMLSIFSLFAGVQATPDSELAGEVFVNRYTPKYLFFGDIDPTDVFNSLFRDTSIVGSDFSLYLSDPNNIESFRSMLIDTLTLVKQDYQNLINPHHAIQDKLALASGDRCNISVVLPVKIEVFQNAIANTISLLSHHIGELHDDIEEHMQEDDISDDILDDILDDIQESTSFFIDFTNIRHHLSNIELPEVTDVPTLIKYLNIYIALKTTNESIDFVLCYIEP